MDWPIGLGIAGFVLAAVAAIGLFIATRPATFRIQRVRTIAAPAATIYPLIADFTRWPEWSPWEKKDPTMKRALSGAPSGTGAVYAWHGNRNIGQGRMEITAAEAPSRIAIQLDFIAPFEAHNTVEFRLAASADATMVTWTMSGANSTMGKALSLVFNMDRMVGKDFEIGLANLTALAERSDGDHA